MRFLNIIKKAIMQHMNWTEQSVNIIDLLRTEPSQVPFFDRVLQLKLSSSLVDKIRLQIQPGWPSHYSQSSQSFLSGMEERELGTEVLLYRHQFTEQVFQSRAFRQAALSVVQNIYLFQHRKIFFGTTSDSTELERQEAIMLLTERPKDGSVPLSKTFQHLIIARVWNRIVSQSTDTSRKTPTFIALHTIVEKLNTLRNIYMILSLGLVHKLVSNINQIYRQSISFEDALQIGSFGIARAAYRYHPSSGVRFSTYAANWVQKEIQRQSLENRLVRISSNLVESFAKASKTGDKKSLETISSLLKGATVNCVSQENELEEIYAKAAPVSSPVTLVENKQLRILLFETIDKVLSKKSADVIKRKYGLPPYRQEQTVIEIGKRYGVTRGSIYQLEQIALKKIKKHFKNMDVVL